MILKKMLQTLLLEEQLLVPVTKHITVRLVLIQIKPIKSVLEQAKEQGKSTGLVTTAELTDATPAVYAAHIDSRDKR